MTESTWDEVFGPQEWRMEEYIRYHTRGGYVLINPETLRVVEDHRAVPESANCVGEQVNIAGRSEFFNNTRMVVEATPSMEYVTPALEEDGEEEETQPAHFTTDNDDEEEESESIIERIIGVLRR